MKYDDFQIANNLKEIDELKLYNYTTQMIPSEKSAYNWHHGARW